MNDDLKEFQELCNPLMKYMRENFDPHAKVILDSNRADLLKGEFGVIDQYEKTREVDGIQRVGRFTRVNLNEILDNGKKIVPKQNFVDIISGNQAPKNENLLQELRDQVINLKNEATKKNSEIFKLREENEFHKKVIYHLIRIDE